MEEFKKTVHRLFNGKEGSALARVFMDFFPSEEPLGVATSEDMDALIFVHAKCQHALRQGHLKEAYELRQRCINLLLPSGKIGLISTATPFLLLLLKRFLLHLRDIALQADKEEGRDLQDGDSGFATACQGFLQRLWATILSDDERNFVCMAIYTVGWQCAYKMNKTTVVYRWNLPPYDYSLQDQVTASYWKGVVQFNKHNWRQAAIDLEFAFDNIPQRLIGHRRCVLWRLVPARLALLLAQPGAAGTPALFREHKMEELGELSGAVVRGDVAAFERNLDAHQDLYAAAEVYFPLLKLRPILYRNLLRRAAAAVQRIAAEGAGARAGAGGRVAMRHLLAVANAAGWAVDAAEFEGVVRCLISDRTIKGKVDSERGDLLLSSSNAFPRTRHSDGPPPGA